MTVSTTYKEAAFAADTPEVPLVLLTISHPSISPPIRLVNNTENITSNGNEFIAFPFTPVWADSREDAPPRARLTIDNVSREIAQAIRSITSPPTVTMQLILASAPDVIEQPLPDFKLRNVTWDAGKVSGELTVEDFTAEPYPAGVFSPASFPGLF